MLKGYPKEQQPREKAINQGISSLSDIELLAILIRTGNKKQSVIELATTVLYETGGISFLKRVTYHDLVKINGIKDAKAIEILAAIELAKRLVDHVPQQMIIKEPGDGYLYVKNKLIFEDNENVILLCLDTKLKVIKEVVISIGTNDASLVNDKEIFKQALICGSSRIMVLHNHPSGNPKPSLEDYRITKHLVEMGRKLNIEVIDHIVVGNHCYYSIMADKLFKESD